jgi:copper resistance protein B
MICTALMIFGLALLPAVVRADAEDDPVLVKLMLDQLEQRGSGNDSEDSWDTQAWIGKDLTKLWIKIEGERKFGKTENAELQFLFSKAVATYWDFQVGIREDFEPSPSRTWAAIGFQGLSPYFFEIDTALFVGESGRTALRFEAEYELLLTQRLILTPEIEMNLYGKSDPAIRIGSGLSDIEAGLRLRYEIRRQFAPYIGINWLRLFGNTADFANIAGRDTSEAQLVIGLRVWL